MKRLAIALVSLFVLAYAYLVHNGMPIYQESRSINWHFGGLNEVNGKWVCELGKHSSLIGALWTRYWAEKRYKPEMGYPAPYAKVALCIDIPKRGEAIAMMVTWPARANGRCYLVDKPAAHGIDSKD